MVSLINQAEARLPSLKKSTFLVVFLDIWYPAVAKKIIDTEIYDKTFNYFVEQVLEVD